MDQVLEMIAKIATIVGAISTTALAIVEVIDGWRRRSKRPRHKA